jgi:hypothetical protein
MKRILLLLITAASIDYASAQTDAKKMADDKKFKFTATAATITAAADPQRAGASISSASNPDNHVTLPAGYTVTVTPDSVASYLPYYDKTSTVADAVGSSTTIQEDPTKATATAYDYEVKDKKNGSVIINIKPKNAGKITKYNFDLSPDGKAKLEATIGNQIVKYDGTYTAL